MEPYNKPLILIVDDTPQNIQVLGNILHEKGYDITIATSGNQALKSVLNKIPDLILLDIQMPEMDGFEVCERLKNASETKDIPVIFLTAVTETENLLHGFELGAVDYITKPFNLAELTARVATHIELKRSKERIEALNRKLNDAFDNINDSITYAKRILDEMLPDLNFLQNEGIGHWVIYKPKDIISGDFYWVKQINEKIFIAVADCTGHGVPGALLSMLGHNLLSEIVNIENIQDAAEILNNLNEKVRGIFKQELLHMRNGMDIALCVIDRKAKTVEYAGANIPVLYFQNNIFKKLSPDKFAIGDDCQGNHKPCFSKQIIEFNTGDRFFMSTDGISDQFGYSNNNKLTRRKFEQQLSLFKDKPFNSIKNDLLQFLKDWQGSDPQTDDILLLGIELS